MAGPLRQDIRLSWSRACQRWGSDRASVRADAVGRLDHRYSPPQPGQEWLTRPDAEEKSLAEVVLFHHAQGLTPGLRRFADQLRAGGHAVTTPDLYGGRTFDTLEAGIAFADEVGFEAVLERGRLAAEELPAESVYGGFSLGVLPAQMLAQTRRGARGALLFHACIPLSEFGGIWPQGVPVQIHAMEADPLFSTDGDLEAARELVGKTDEAELFLYPGDQHLFADESLSSYDEAAAAVLLERTLVFLGQLA